MCAISLVVRIAAFQAVDPGSNPGWRITFPPRHLATVFVILAGQSRLAKASLPNLKSNQLGELISFFTNQINQ